MRYTPYELRNQPKFKKMKEMLEAVRAPEENAVYMTNRNPRNLEMMRIAQRPKGYHLEVPGKLFWLRLVLSKTSQGLTAQVEHKSGQIVLQASSAEWSFAKHLYKTNDTCAYINFGKVFANRCLEAGFIEMENFNEYKPNGKISKFIEEFERNGVRLQESPQYIKAKPSDNTRMDRPWRIDND